VTKLGSFLVSERFLLFIVALIILLPSGKWFYTMTLTPWMQSWTAAGWEEMPCRVTDSRCYSGTHGTAVFVSVQYSYTYRGQNYSSSRYSFFDGPTIGLRHRSKMEIVAQYPPGTATVCYVNPADPKQAVISRKAFPAGLQASLPLLFLIVGTAFMLRAFKVI